jgi:hypothetical protein
VIGLSCESRMGFRMDASTSDLDIGWGFGLQYVSELKECGVTVSCGGNDVHRSAVVVRMYADPSP